MEKKSLNLRYNLLIKSLKTLEISVRRSNDPTIKDVFDEIRDSKIQRFEYTIDTFWKYLSDYLTNKGIILKQINPKDIFRACFINKILSDKDFDTLLKAVDDRNATSHNYGEDFSKRVTKNIDQYYQIMYNVTKKLSPDS